MKVRKSLLAAIGLAAAAILNNSAAFADDSNLNARQCRRSLRSSLAAMRSP